MITTEMKFKELWKDWNETQRGVPADSARYKADMVRYAKYVQPKFGNMQIGKITKRIVEGWLEKSLAEGVGPQTMQQCLVTMRQAMETAVEAGVIRSNPLKGVLIEQIKGLRSIQESEVLTEDQFERLVEHISARYQALVLLAGRLGLTWSEALGLRISDVDFGGRAVRVGQTLAIETSGKLSYREGPKPRRLEISTEVSRALAETLILTQPYRAEGNDRLFISESGNHPLRSNFNVFVLRPALREAGLNDRAVTFHTLRHTAAAHLLDNGIPLEQVSFMLGHSGVSTTRRYYGRLAPGKLIT